MLDSLAAPHDAAASNEPNTSTDALVAVDSVSQSASASASAATIDLLPHATPLPRADADADADADAALALALEPFAGIRFSGMFRACVPALQALHNQCFPIIYSDSFYEQLVAGDEYSTIVALSEADGSVVGFATGRVESDVASSVVCRAQRTRGYISTFGVAPSYRGRGLGSVLLKVLCQ
jgi:GNAT superfamily N-acetyltransferase